MALFLSTFVNRIDRKGRVSVPVSFRTALAADGFNGAVMFPSITLPAIEGWGMKQMEDLSDGIDAFDPFSEERDAFSLSILSQAQQISFDPEGRVVLSGELIEHAALAGEAAFVGRGSTFQVWEPSALRAGQQAAREQARRERHSLKLPRRERGA